MSPKGLMEPASVVRFSFKGLGHASSNSFITFNLYLYNIQPLLRWEE